jgi:hypothetical protein
MRASVMRTRACAGSEVLDVVGVTRTPAVSDRWNVTVT